MNDRIALILKYKNINAAKFAEELDVQRSGISHLLAGRNKPSLELIQKILKVYPEISPEWLISGKGAMLKNPDLFAEPPQPLAKQILPEPDVLTGVPEPETKNTSSPDTPVLVEAAPQQPSLPAEKSVVKTIENAVKGNEKNIEKIIFFFSDKTFSVYTPT